MERVMVSWPAHWLAVVMARQGTRIRRGKISAGMIHARPLRDMQYALSDMESASVRRRGPGATHTTKM